MLIIELLNGDILEISVKNYKYALKVAKSILKYEGIKEEINNKTFINSIGKEKYFKNKNLIAYLR